MANTIPSELKRNAILLDLNVALTAFKARLIALTAFSVVFRDVALEGTDKVSVPYYPLESQTSTNFDDSDGYLMGDTAVEAREVTIDRRKYQSFSVSSRDIARQPAFNRAQYATLKANKLATDVFTDILGAVTLANYGAAVFTGAASTFTSDSVAALKLAAKTWPEDQRALVLASEYDANLLKDQYIKSALASGSTDALRNGKVGKRLSGFDYIETPSIPANGEDLTGFICHPSALLVAFSPIAPTEEVGRMVAYEQVTDPETGISLEYRRWGNADMDQTSEVIECNYGFEVGNSAALKRIVSA